MPIVSTDQIGFVFILRSVVGTSVLCYSSSCLPEVGTVANGTEKTLQEAETRETRRPGAILKDVILWMLPNVPNVLELRFALYTRIPLPTMRVHVHWL